MEGIEILIYINWRFFWPFFTPVPVINKNILAFHIPFKTIIFYFIIHQ